MSTLLAAGAFLAVGMAVAHSYLGERYILVRLFRRDNLPRLYGGDTFTRRTIRLAWHVTSIAWAGFGALLWPGTFDPLAVVAATFAASAVLTAAVSRGRHLAWVVMLAIAAAAWWGR